MKHFIMLCALFCLCISCKNATEKPEATPEIEVQTNLDIIQGVYLSLEQGNIEAFIAAMDEQIVWNEAENYPYDDLNPYIGPNAVMEGIMGRVASEWDDFTVADRKFYNMDNDMVLVTGRYTAVYKATGKPINAQMAHHWTLKDGKIVQFQQYADTKQVADALIAE